MPSIATHYIFSQDVLLKLSSSSHIIPSTIKKASGAYILGAQGPDIFFYDLCHLTVTKKKDNIGSHMHSYRTDNFFVNYIREMFRMSYQNKPAVSAYIMGFLTHYCLDCSVHPYVYSVTTLPDNSRESIRNSLAAHCQLESDIDELFYYERFNSTINNKHRGDFMNISNSEIKDISPVLAAAINDTYGCSLTTSYIEGTFKRAILTDNILQDNSGFKKKLFSPIEKKLTGSSIGASLIFHTELPDRACLNEAHNVWRVPATKKLCTDSFYDLYNKGLQQAVFLINEYNSCFSDISELYMINTLNSGTTTSKSDMADIFSNLGHDTEPSNSASVQLINKLILTFGRATKGLSYHTGINWRRG